MLAYSSGSYQCAFFSLSPDRHLGYPPAPALGTRHPPFYWLKFKNPEAQSGGRAKRIGVDHEEQGPKAILS